MTFTPTQVYTFIVSVLAFIASVGAAATVIGKAVAKAKQPETDQNNRIKNLEERMSSVESTINTHVGYFRRDDERMTALEEANKVLMRALLAILAHEIDGNNTAELKTAHRELQDYLLRK